MTLESEKSVLENVDTGDHPPRANDETLHLLGQKETLARIDQALK